MAKSTITVNEPVTGRDPAKGRVAFKTGVVKTRKDRARKRGDKFHERELSNQINP